MRPLGCIPSSGGAGATRLRYMYACSRFEAYRTSLQRIKVNLTTCSRRVGAPSEIHNSSPFNHTRVRRQRQVTVPYSVKHVTGGSSAQREVIPTGAERIKVIPLTIAMNTQWMDLPAERRRKIHMLGMVNVGCKWHLTQAALRIHHQKASRNIGNYRQTFPRSSVLVAVAVRVQKASIRQASHAVEKLPMHASSSHWCCQSWLPQTHRTGLPAYDMSATHPRCQWLSWLSRCDDAGWLTSYCWWKPDVAHRTSSRLTWSRLNQFDSNKQPALRRISCCWAWTSMETSINPYG